jgi:chromosomal replication initiation ATPase DnaA
MLEHIDPGRLRGPITDSAADLRRENIERAARDFHFEQGPGQVEYIREMQRSVQEGEAGYDIAALLWQLAGIRPDPRQVFDKFLLKKNKTLKDALEATKAWASYKGPPFLTLAGPPGVGKSFLAIAAAQAIVSRNGLVMYRRADELLEEYKRETFDRRRRDMDVDLKAVTYLIIDDLGMQQSSAWSDPFMDGLVDHRYRSRARLMVCTNAKSEDLPARIADRLADRLIGKVIQIDAPSHRRDRYT